MPAGAGEALPLRTPRGSPVTERTDMSPNPTRSTLQRIMQRLVLLIGLGCALLAPLAQAQDAAARAEQAVADILFDANADDFTTYRVSAHGFVDINFARNTPDPIYSDLLAKLKSHPDIRGVLAGKSLAPCKRF